MVPFDKVIIIYNTKGNHKMSIPAVWPAEATEAVICDLMELAYQNIRTQEDAVNWTNRIKVPLPDLMGRFDESTVFFRDSLGLIITYGCTGDCTMGKRPAST